MPLTFKMISKVISFSWDIFYLIGITYFVMGLPIQNLFQGTFIDKLSMSLNFIFSYICVLLVPLFCFGLSKVSYKHAVYSFKPPDVIIGTNNKEEHTENLN